MNGTLTNHICNSLTIILRRTCARLRSIVEDRSLLWSQFDLSTKPLLAFQLRQRYRFLHEKTHTFRARGYGEIKKENKGKAAWLSLTNTHVTMTAAMLSLLQEKCPHLRKLELSAAVLHVQDQFNTLKFPASLQSLTLIRVRILYSPLMQLLPISFPLSNMRLLNTVCIEYCSWFHPSCLTDLGQLEHLRHLSLRGCPDMHDSSRYIDARVHFQQLSTFDLRHTTVIDCVIQRIQYAPLLRELYMWSPGHSHSKRITDDSIGKLGEIITFVDRQVRLREATDVQLERLTVRGYSGITNITLQHLAEFAPRLRMLDLRQTRVTPDGVMAFRVLRPECELLADDHEGQSYQDTLDEVVMVFDSDSD